MGILKQFFKGTKQMCLERPIAFMVIAAGAVTSVIYIFHDGNFHWDEFISALFFVFVLIEVVGVYGAKKAPKKQSEAMVQKVSDVLEMRIVSYVSGGADPSLGTRIIDYDAGNIVKIYVSFENNTGESIHTDTSFAFEQKIMGKWYVLEPLVGAEMPWAPLEIPAGHSEKLCIPTEGRYQSLNPGDYRMIKTVPTNQGDIVLSAVFTVYEV